jgi:hypothetical protein
VQQKRHHLKKDARSLDDIIQALGGSGETADYDAASIRRAGEVIARAAKDGKSKSSVAKPDDHS